MSPKLQVRIPIDWLSLRVAVGSDITGLKMPRMDCLKNMGSIDLVGWKEERNRGGENIYVGEWWHSGMVLEDLYILKMLPIQPWFLKMHKMDVYGGIGPNDGNGLSFPWQTRLRIVKDIAHALN
ncbi:hypothetical protein FEM48_Zijuj08G0174700 [Ziziphus jujuba var. spinosa]|uniref:Uncharacterized protein n=1 Tax=Ziziphus jujuba var. spinosa TaxID=714518 RepID=A0A978V0E8_ZIZJJ|nr:hypothetical protein FEM48_Zijuj08G0174700 [Ziziphus jujuba var. spinosa]